MLSFPLRASIILFFSFILTACGGGGGGGGGSSDDQGPNTVNGQQQNRLLPSDTVSNWQYNNGSFIVTYDSPIRVGNDQLDVRSYPTGGKDYFFTTEDLIAWRGFYSPQVFVSGVGDFTIDVVFDRNFSLYSAGQQAGTSVSFSASGYVDITPTYGRRDITVTGTSTFVGFESITTPYGSFDNATRIRFNVSVSTVVEGLTITIPRSIEFWLVEDIGVVRFIENRQSFSLNNFTAPDRDSDGISDTLDAFPSDPNESVDTDGDGIGNNADTDDDGDGINDASDNCPLIPASEDTDNDCIANSDDNDSDNDGVENAQDPFPLDPTESSDTDGDGIGNNADTDDDGDGIPDSEDEFPLNAPSSNDIDGDGIDNAVDTDDDNDGVNDSNDVFPLDPSESVDTDGDGIGDNTDTDIDGDGVQNDNDLFPLDSSESSDFDGDGIGDNADDDRDGDGFSNDREEQAGSDPNDANSIPTEFDLGETNQLSFRFSDTATSDELSNVLTIASNNGNNINWSASVNTPWLSLNQTSGNTDSNTGVELSLVTDELANLGVGDFSGTLTLTADDSNVPSVDLTIVVTQNHPIFNFVAPYVWYTDDVGTDYMVLRGQGFNQLTQDIWFGSEVATSVSVISDTEVRITPPALEQGRYNLTITGNNLAFSKAELLVKSAPSYSDASIPTDIGLGERYFFDEEREVIFGVQCYFCIGIQSGTSSSIFRFNFSGVDGWQMTTHNYPGLFDAALTPDGKELLVLTRDQLFHVNPDTMETNQVVNLPFTPGGSALEMAVMNDGLVLFIDSLRTYSLLDGSFGEFNLPGRARTLGIGVSMDGSKAVTGHVNNSNPPPLNLYSASTNEWTATSIGYNYSRAKLDRHGNRFFISNLLFDESLGLLGALPTGFLTSFGALSYDGQTAYSYNHSTDQILRADLTGLPPYTVLDPIDIQDPGSFRMALNHNGEILFLVGTDRFIVIDLNAQ